MNYRDSYCFGHTKLSVVKMYNVPLICLQGNLINCGVVNMTNVGICNNH